MRAPLVLFVVSLVLAVALGDLASRHLGPVPYIPTASGQEGGLLDDGGTGGDAGDSRSTASPLAAFGHYAAGFTGMDADWYSHPATLVSAPGCVTLSAQGDRLNDVRLEGTAHARLVSTRPSTTLALAMPVFDTTYVAFNSLTAHTALQSAYEFTTAFTGQTLEGGDGGSGLDAGSKDAYAVRIDAVCEQGSVGGSGDGLDVYRFDASPGDQIVVSLSSTDGDRLKFALLGKENEAIKAAQSGELITYTATGVEELYVAIWDDTPEATAGPAAGIVMAEGPTEEEEAQRPYVLALCRPFCILE